MGREFIKMHGLGNDYIFFDCFKTQINNPGELSVKLSNRRFSIGSDGIILVGKSDKADCSMRIFNADGSEGEMCGNGIRCVGKFLYEYKNIRKNIVTVDTKAGIKTLYLQVDDNGKVVSVSVEMGKAVFECDKIPVFCEKDELVEMLVNVEGAEWKFSAVSMGNPHAVIFLSDVEELQLAKIGPSFEKMSFFPNKTNTEFVKVLGKNHLRMRVWERGSGETSACGTGACAICAVAAKLGLVDFNTPITVVLDGGELSITVNDDYSVLMTGPCVESYKGILQEI